MIIWIASYPKSGNTWLRALISSYYFSENGVFNQNSLEKIAQFPEKRYFTNFKYNPKIATDTSKYWIKAQDLININKELKFLKTHNILGAINNSKFTNKKNTIGAIYVVRDPRNIITSLQNHYEMTLEKSLEFILNEKKFIHDYINTNDYSDFQFISSWEKHYRSWLNQKNFPVKMIKYEDLISNTLETFIEVIEFIKLITDSKVCLDKKKVENSVQSTTKKEGFTESVLSKNTSKKISFFYLGPQNNWKKIFNKNYQKKLNTIFKANLKELNYF